MLIKYEFDAVDTFKLYKTSMILIRMIKIARTDYRYFLLLLILLVKCYKGHTNSTFHSLIVHNDLMLFDDELDKEHNIKFVENIWYLLFINESYDYFEKKLEEMNLYNRLYENVYREMYQLYQLNNEEHEIDTLYNDDIIRYIEKRSK